jgi:hypothetical protein
MSEQMIAVILSGLILLVNGFLFFWIKDIKGDVRDLRKDYLAAITGSLEKVAELNIRIEKLNGTIELLRCEITYLKSTFVEEKIET